MLNQKAQRRGISLSLLLAALTWPLASSANEASPSPQAQVEAAERAFAKTMADRDFDAFGRYVASDAIFFGGGDKIQRGRDEVLAEWRRFYEGEQAPFSWEPIQVEVLSTGTLAHSRGPVRDPAGNVIAHFNSVWRLDDDGQWRVVFDRGERVCPPAAPQQD